MSKQKGFAIVEFVIVFIVLAIISFAIWRLIATNQTSAPAVMQEPTPTTDDIPKPNNLDDLEKIDTQLEEIQIDSGIEDQLNKESEF